jgi:MarR family 2-MHQ and catechol resistance regulon transcriptional repressor
MQAKSMKNKALEPIHVWLVMMKAFRAIGRYSMADIRRSELGESDFRVLEVLLHKGPMPVNAIGPKVYLNPGSISVAVDRLHCKGLVTREEDHNDRRVRVVALTAEGKKLIEHIFKEHTKAMNQVFTELSPKELEALESAMKKVGKRAEALGKDEADIGECLGGECSEQ